MTAPTMKELAEELVNEMEVARSDENAYYGVEELKKRIEAFGNQIRERTIDEIQEIVNDALDHESSLSDTEKGHMRSMHIGAMDALGGIMDEILKLKGKQ